MEKTTGGTKLGSLVYNKKPPVTDYNFYYAVNCHPDASVFLSYAKSRINKNKNFIIAIVGETGGGKSWSSLSILETLSIMLNVPLSIQNNYAWTPYEFMMKHNAGMPKGSGLCLDEGGTAINAKRFMSNVNIAIGNLYQTSRLYNYIYILNLPDLGFLDKTVRKLLHCIIEVKHIDYERNRTMVIPKLLMFDRTNADNKGESKIYRKYLRVKRPFEPLRPVTGLWVYKPSDGLIVEYEKAKRDFTDRLCKSIEGVVRDPVMDGKGGVSGELSDLQAKALYLRNIERLKHGDVAKALGISLSYLNKQYGDVKQLGYDVMKFTVKESADLNMDKISSRLEKIDAKFFNNKQEDLSDNARES